MYLVIESSLKRSSISICDKENVLGFREFTVGTSLAKFLLDSLEDLLLEIGNEKSVINKILVSNGPGSLTGIRVGISTALGLASSFNINCLGISLLESLAFKFGSDKVISAIKINEEHIYCQLFENDRNGIVRLLDKENFNSLLNSLNGFELVIYNDKEGSISYSSNETEKEIVENNLSKYLYFKYQNHKIKGDYSTPEPIYLQKVEFKKLF